MYGQNKVLGRQGVGQVNALANNNRMLSQNNYLMNQPSQQYGNSMQGQQMNGQNGSNAQIFQQQQQLALLHQQQQQNPFLNGVKTCKWHKGQVYIAVCSSDMCRMGRLCCLRCMVSKHTDHTQNLILLDELRDSDLMSLSVPTNWTNTLGPLKEDIQSIIGVCKVSNVNNDANNQEEELAKIDDMFDTFTKEIVEDIEKVRTHVKTICKEKNQGSSDRLTQLTNTLRKVLSPMDLLTIVDEFIMQGSDKNEQLNSTSKTSGKNLAVLQQQVEQELEEKLNTFFTSPRVTTEDSDVIYKNYNFLCKKDQHTNSDAELSNYVNWNALNEIREQMLNVMQNKSKFAEIFFPDSVLYSKFDNLDKVRSLTGIYDEITVPSGVITSVEAIDNERFMVVRDQDLMEVWNIESHKKEYSYCISGSKSLITPIKTRGRLLVAFVSGSQTSIQIADTQSRKIIKSFNLTSIVRGMKVLSAKDEDCVVVDSILLSVLLETGEVKIVDMTKNQITDLRNKNTFFMEILPEIRCYQLTVGEENALVSKGIVSSYGLITASNDLLSVWYPLSQKCVRNIKVVLRPNEVLKQIGSFEISNYEKQQTYFSDSVAGCPSKTAIALLTNKSLRIFNWFKANCVREIPIEDCNNFQILQSFIQNELKNIFLLYNVGENKPAEYATCDWSTQKVEYWNSGSLSNFTCIKTLNNYKILELGKHSVKNSDSKKAQGPLVNFEIRARIKSLN